MILPKSSDAPHKYQMYRLLTAIISDTQLAKVLVFKGGTCAVLRGWLDRFSIDLDFDLIDKSGISLYRQQLYKTFNNLNFTIKDQSQKHLQFFLKYPASQEFRNTLKLEINDDISPYNESEIANLNELNLTALTQTRPTMVANKMVAALNRYRQHGTIAGRDFYDLHYFLTKGFDIRKEIVEERMNMKFNAYTRELVQFVSTKLTDKLLFEDLNPLLPQNELKKSISHLRQELLWMLEGLAKQ